MSDHLTDPNQILNGYRYYRNENAKVLELWPAVRDGNITEEHSKAWYFQETSKMLSEVDKHMEKNPSSEELVGHFTKAIDQWEEAKSNFRIRGGRDTRHRRDARLFYDIDKAINMLRDLSRYITQYKHWCHVTQVNSDGFLVGEDVSIRSQITARLYHEGQPNPDTVTYQVDVPSTADSLVLRLVNPDYEEKASTEMEAYTGGSLQDRLVVHEGAYVDEDKGLAKHMQEFKTFLPMHLRDAMCDVLKQELADLKSRATTLRTQSESSSRIVESRKWLTDLMSGIEQLLRKEPSMTFSSIQTDAVSYT